MLAKKNPDRYVSGRDFLSNEIKRSGLKEPETPDCWDP
jgi:hypothetical protein